MVLELELKISKTRDNPTIPTTSYIQIAKDHTGPRFSSEENENMFILKITYLKGFRRERIKIAINEDGTQIAISGDRPLQGMVKVRWTMFTKVEIKGFRKVFWIPDGVVLDRIKARLNEEEAILSIFMPKSIKGIRGIGIEEVKEEEDEVGRSGGTPSKADEFPDRDLTQEALQLESEQLKIERGEESDRIRETSSATPEAGRQEESEEVEGRRSGTPPSVADEFPERDLTQEALQPESEQLKIERGEESDRIGETSSATPEAGRQEESKGVEGGRSGTPPSVGDEFPERDLTQEALLPESEQSKIESGEERDRIGEVSSAIPEAGRQEESEEGQGGRSRTPPSVADEFSERDITQEALRPESEQLKIETGEERDRIGETSSATPEAGRQEESEEVDGGRSGTPPSVADEFLERDLIQEALQPESEQLKIERGEERDRIGETSSATPEVGRQEESEEVEGGRSGTPPSVADEIPESDLTQEALQPESEQLKIERGEESDRNGETSSATPETGRQEESEEVECGRSGTPPSVADEFRVRDRTQEALQPESEQLKIEKGEESDRIGETSSAIPETGRQESEETSTPDTLEFPATMAPDPEKEIRIPTEVQPARNLDQSNTSDSPPFEEIRIQQPPEVQEQMKHNIPEVETKTQDQESQEHNHRPPETVEQKAAKPDQVLHESETTEGHLIQEIRDENVLREQSAEVETKETEQELRKNETPVTETLERSPETVESMELKPDQGLHPSKTPDPEHPQNHEIGDDEFQGEGNHDEETEIREEHKEIDQVKSPIRSAEAEVKSPAKEERLEEEPNLGFAEAEEEVETETETETERRSCDKSTQTDKPTPSRKSPPARDISTQTTNPRRAPVPSPAAAPSPAPARSPSPARRSPCGPCVFAGSAFLMSLIVLVISLLRQNKKTKKY